MANRKLVELLIEEDQDAFGVEAISLVKFPAIEENWIAFSKDKKSRVLSLASIDEDKRTLIGAALIPDKNIPRYDELSDEEYDVFFSQDTVKLASELFLKTNRTNEHTLEHQEKVDGVSVVESWIVSDPEMDKAKHFGMEMPVGTWMVRVHVGNDEMWEAVKEGSIRGFSIEGYFVDSVQEMSTKVEKGSVKKTLSRMWNFLKRKFYVEIQLDNGTILATEDDALTPGSKVFTLDDEGMPIELNNGKFKTGGGIELEVFEGVLIEYDGEVKAIEDEVEEMEKVELDEMKVKYYKALLKGKIKDYLGIYQNFRILGEMKTKTKLMTKPADIELTDEITIIFNIDHSVEVEYYDAYRTLVVSYDRFINDGFDYEDDPPFGYDKAMDDATYFERLVLDWENA